MPKIDLTVKVGGRVVGGVTQFTASHSINQPANRFSFSVNSAQDWIRKNMEVEVWGGFAGRTGLLAKGYITTDSEQIDVGVCDNPFTYSGTNNGMLVTLAYPGDGVEELDKDYSGQVDEAIVQNLAESAGIPSSMTSIIGKGRALGVVKPLIFQKGSTPWDLISRIDEAVGYLTFWGPDNVARRMQWFGIPSIGSSLTLEFGVNLKSYSLVKSIEGIRNKSIVRGVYNETTEIVASVQIDNPLIRNPPRFVADEYSNDLIETLPHANECAQYRLNQFNREVRDYAVTADGDHRYIPGMTVRCKIPARGIDENFFIDTASHNITVDDTGEGEFSTSMVIIGGFDSAILIEGLPPVVYLTVNAFQEYEAGVGPITVVTCSASGTYSPNGDVVSYAWDIDPEGTPVNGTTTTPFFTTRIAGTPPSATVTLLVTDSASETGTTTQTVTINPSRIASETIWLAMPNMVRCSTNGGNSWNEFNTASHGDPICLAPRAGSWGQIWGCSNGKLIVSPDFLTTDPNVIDIGATDPVRAVWITEGADDRVWALCDDGSVIFSANRGIDFDVVGLIEGAGQAHWIQEDYSGNGTINVCYGDSVYRSYDSGTTFETVYTFDGGIAQALAFGYGKYYALGTTSPYIVDLEGDDPTLDAPSLTIPTAITLGVRQPCIIMADDDGRVYRSGEDLATLEQVGTTTGSLYHLVRSGGEEGIVYAGTTEGFEKSVDYGTTWFLSGDFSGQAVRMIGYGDVRGPDPGKARIYVGAHKALYVYEMGSTAWQSQTVPSFIVTESRNIIGVYPQPNSSTLCVIHVSGTMECVDGILRLDGSTGESPFYITTTAGETWEPLIIKFPDTWEDQEIGYTYDLIRLIWDYTDTSRWNLSFVEGGGDPQPIVFFGTTVLQVDGSHILAVYDYTDRGSPITNVLAPIRLVASLSDDFVGSVHPELPNDPRTNAWFSGDSSTLNLRTRGAGFDHICHSVVPGSRAMYTSQSWYRDTNYAYTPDYRTTDPVQVSTAITNPVVATTHGVYHINGIDGTIEVVTAPTTTTPVAVELTEYPYASIKSWAIDPDRTLIYLLSNDLESVLYDGTVMNSIPPIGFEFVVVWSVALALGDAAAEEV